MPLKINKTSMVLILVAKVTMLLWIHTWFISSTSKDLELMGVYTSRKMGMIGSN